MSDPLQIRIYEKQQMVFESGELVEPVELGRQKSGEEGPYCFKKAEKSGCWRLVMASVEEDTVSRHHLRVEPLPGDKCRLTNLRDRQPIRLDDSGAELKPKGSQEVALPFVLAVGSKIVRLAAVQVEDNLSLHTLLGTPRPPVSPGDTSSRFSTLAWSPAPGIDSESVFQWLQSAMAVLQSASSSSDFFQTAAQAAVDMVGLDFCQVFTFAKNQWKMETFRTSLQGDNAPRHKSSQRVLNKVVQEKRTFWQMPSLDSSSYAPSLSGFTTVVAAPILDPKGEVIGALYGGRLQGNSSLPQVNKVEAMLVELLACGVAAGLARVEQEKAALTARVQFEQFFTPQLSQMLASNPDMLQGQDAEVTILFCDIRGFSRVSERLGPVRTVEWISEVMAALSDCVSFEEGVLVDYIGDELMAMWGAPVKQPDHARLACKAALRMLEEVPKLNARWQPILEEPFGLGIGLNSGWARVGNTGSPRKFKYGPLGNTVNLASRVQGASKYLKARLLVTGSTQAALDSGFSRRRLAKVRVVNITEPVDLYEVVPAGQPGWSQLKENYERALEDFEKGEFGSATKILANLRGDFPTDGPALVLLARAVNALVSGFPEHHPVWELPGK